MSPRSWAAFLLITLIRAYQRLLSPLLGPRCRFYPSCSSYAAQALGRHGLIRGAYLGFRRVLRCHPWNPGGVDEVPERFSVRRSTAAHGAGPAAHGAGPAANPPSGRGAA